MIRNFANKIAKDIWEKDTSRDFPRPMHRRAKVLLTIMHATDRLDDLKVKGQAPALRFHKLKGSMKDRWAVAIDGPWRITFKFESGEFIDVKIEDYH